MSGHEITAARCGQMVTRLAVALVAVALVAVAIVAGGLTGCRDGSATGPRGVVAARRSLYVGSTWRWWLVIRRADGVKVEEVVGKSVWRRCQTRDRYPDCARGR